MKLNILRLLGIKHSKRHQKDITAIRIFFLELYGLQWKNPSWAHNAQTTLISSNECMATKKKLRVSTYPIVQIRYTHIKHNNIVRRLWNESKTGNCTSIQSNDEYWRWRWRWRQCWLRWWWRGWDITWNISSHIKLTGYCGTRAHNGQKPYTLLCAKLHREWTTEALRFKKTTPLQNNMIRLQIGCCFYASLFMFVYMFVCGAFFFSLVFFSGEDNLTVIWTHCTHFHL